MNDSYSNDYDRPYRPARRDDGAGNDGYSARGPRRGNSGGGGRRREDVRDEVFSTQVRAGRRRYFFDVRDTQAGDYYLTITEVKRTFEGAAPEKHKIFLYKEDFTKFIHGLQDTIDYVKSNLLTADQLDDLDRGDAQYEEDERYYRELRAQRAAEDARPPADPAAGPYADDQPEEFDANRRDDY